MDKMIQEKSAGIILYRMNEVIEYLLLHYPAGHWDYPKGHVEEGENEIETALRELEEETGISGEDVEVIDDFRESINYIYRKGSQLSHKEVVFFLAKTEIEDVKLSYEHQGYTWLPFDEALEKLTFKNAKQLLKKTKEYID
ncbi:MAG: bis(5'-nucleosyl)-tetraphosphatase [Thermoplasmatota archaeon]